ncbi:MAG: hypothetical protein K6F77_02505 [Lachnospiraceae bacterium]|nr:hypothetical protein [Lachnospiraceae bacterium]
MDLYLIANIFTLVCALIGFIWGGILFLHPRKALYAQMITLALGCIAFGRLFNVIRLLTGGSITERFQLGFFGMVGSLMFFISSNYGAIDSLIDDGTKKFKKYRAISIIAPCVAIILYLVLFIAAGEPKLWKILGGILTAFIVFSSYFHLKHIVFPDVEFGIVKFLRPFNAVALLYDIAILVECSAMGRENNKVMIVSTFITGVFTALLMPMVVRGVRKWYQ